MHHNRKKQQIMSDNPELVLCANGDCCFPFSLGLSDLDKIYFTKCPTKLFSANGIKTRIKLYSGALVLNYATVDRLVMDMDSCEYLSKHFGTRTIHKASDSDAKDYKGQPSRSEDVMQKSLLSAEDIFAMKKDGECAIVVKGTAPLFETNVRWKIHHLLNCFVERVILTIRKRENQKEKIRNVRKEDFSLQVKLQNRRFRLVI